MNKFIRILGSGSFLLFVGTLSTCLLIAEVAVRLSIFGVKGLSYSEMTPVVSIGESGLVQASAYQDILWELRPNIQTKYKFKPFNTNSAGLRDREHSLEKAPGIFRVAVIGDSFTMGEGIAIEDSYHSILEARFNADGEKRRYEFINFGVAGYSLVQYLATIEHKALAYQPDLILIGFCAANDSEVPNFEAFKKPYQVKAVANGFFKSYFFEMVGDLYKYFYKKVRNRQSGYDADPEYVDREFANLAGLMTGKSIPVVIAYIDNKFASLDFAMVREKAQKYGFTFVDGTPYFPPEIKPEYIIYQTDNHPNAAGNRLIAAALYEALRTTKYFAVMK